MLIVKMVKSGESVEISNQAKTVVTTQPISSDIETMFGRKDTLYAKASIKGGTLTIKSLIKPKTW